MRLYSGKKSIFVTLTEIKSIMRNRLFILLLLISGVLSAQPEIKLYVSPTGNDSYPGTAERPLASLNKAWQKAGKKAGKQTITIYCRQGTHYLTAPITITSKTSGNTQHPVRFCSYPEEQAVISTSARLTNLKWTPYKREIVQARVEGNPAFDQLFVNGEQQPMARYPNRDTNIAIFHGYAADAIAPERVAQWQNPAGGFIHAMHSREWGGYQYVIEGKDAKGELILGGGFQNNRQMGMHPEYRMVENIFEELDAEGEWYFDTKSKTLYFYPPKGLNLQTAIFEVPQSESIFILKGEKGKPVKNIEIEGLELTQTLRTFMKTDEPLLRSD